MGNTLELPTKERQAPLSECRFPKQTTIADVNKGWYPLSKK
jgi:hypothetical protein